MYFCTNCHYYTEKENLYIKHCTTYTHYGSNCKANNSLKKDLGLNSNYDYRQYLIKNGYAKYVILKSKIFRILKHILTNVTLRIFLINIKSYQKNMLY